MNQITINGQVTSIRETSVNGQRVANIFVNDYVNGKMITFQASFWKEMADFVLEKVEKEDVIELSGFIKEIVNSDRGPYIAIRNCELKSYTKQQKILVGDILSHW